MLFRDHNAKQRKTLPEHTGIRPAYAETSAFGDLAHRSDRLSVSLGTDKQPTTAVMTYSMSGRCQ